MHIAVLSQGLLSRIVDCRALLALRTSSNSKLILSSTNSWHFRCFLCLLVYKGHSFIKSTILQLAKAAVNLVNIHKPKFQPSSRVRVFDSRGWPKFKLSILVIILLCGNLFLWICGFCRNLQEPIFVIFPVQTSVHFSLWKLICNHDS